VWSGVCSSRPSGFGEAARRQPVNLGFEGAEESLSTRPDYTPTVRPRPGALDHVDRDMQDVAQRPAATSNLLHLYMVLSEPGGVPWAGGSASWRAAPRVLPQAARSAASRMEGAGAAKSRRAPSQHKQVAHSIARRMAEAGAVSRRAASSQSLELQAARSARYVCGAHFRSPTMRRRSNPQHTTCHSACANGRRSSGWWRISH
jgi:hypothetical protein